MGKKKSRNFPALFYDVLGRGESFESRVAARHDARIKNAMHSNIVTIVVPSTIASTFGLPIGRSKVECVSLMPACGGTEIKTRDFSESVLGRADMIC